MATKFTAGTVINAGAVIVGVDADAPPATPSAPAPEPAPVSEPQILPLSSAVSLLMDASATADGSVVDSSTNSHAITVNGDVSQSSYSPYRSGGYSWQFNGQGHYITKTNSNDAPEFNFVGEDFTVEFWMNLNGSNHSNNPVIMGGQQGWYVQLKNTDSRITFYDNSTEHEADVTLDNNAWYHVAVTRSGSTLRTFLNGTEVYSGTSSTSAGRLYNSDFIIASYSTHPQLAYNGFLSDIRVVKGTALYTESFTPPTERLTEVAGTSLLTCNKPYLQSGLTITGDVPMVAKGPYDYVGYSESLHGGSIVFDNADGNSLSMTGSADFQLDDDFTLESWVNIVDNGKWQPLAMWGNGHYKTIRIAGRNTSITEINIEYPNSYVFVTHPTPVHGTGWHHIAIVRSASTITLYVDGVAGNTVALSNTIGTTEDFKVGYHTTGGGNHWVDGSFADYRLVKGTAVYTEVFTPPTAPLEAVTGTSLLISGNNAAIRDESQTAEKLTVHGSIPSSDSSPYGSGKSMDFSGSYITSSDGIDFSDNDFTIELWWYPTDAGRQGLFHGSYGADWSIGIDYNSTYNNPTLGFWASSNGSSWDIANSDPGGNGITTGSPTQNAWNHIAYVRNGSTLTMYLNGVNVGEVTGVTVPIHSKTNTHQQSIGTWWKATGWGGGPMSGNVADYRISLEAVYTENFSVPTAPLGDYSESTPAPEPAPAPVELLGDVTVSDIFSGQSISSVHSSGGIEVNRGSTNEGVVIELDVQSGYTYELKYFGGVGPHSVPNKVQHNQMWVATVPSGRSIPTNIMDKSNYNILKREDGSFGTVFIDTSLQPFSDPNNVDENGLLAVWSTTGTFTVPEDISKVHLIFFDGNPDNTGHYVKTISVMSVSS